MRVMYTPPVGFTGLDQFTYRISNVDGSVATATVTVDVSGDTFEVVSDSIEVSVGEPFAIQLAANDELAGLGVTYGVIGMLPDGVELSSSGVVSGSFDREAQGSVGVSVTLANGQSAGSTLTWLARVGVPTDPWLSPAYESTPQSDAERVALGLGGLATWNDDYSITAADLKGQGDELG